MCKVFPLSDPKRIAFYATSLLVLVLLLFCLTSCAGRNLESSLMEAALMQLPGVSRLTTTYLNPEGGPMTYEAELCFQNGQCFRSSGGPETTEETLKDVQKQAEENVVPTEL